ncbi:MAG: hypothetical protein NVV63_12565 [Opitutus sp.]|nr:hypothetical protein [Opitutus sp.]
MIPITFTIGDADSTVTGLGIPSSIRVWVGGRSSKYRIDLWD